ncbi:MAG: HD domain-containing protein [candidate division Zixibacteria bacterium]|nr:HD domain-containing protein [candidate division Zixibacteria bacterium]
MIRKSFILKIFDAANMQRWNDKIRPVELRELDKQAHKMIIAWVLGKIEEENNSIGFDWIEIIEGGIFELLQRIIVTDLKPPLFNRIKADNDKYKELNKWVYKEIEPVISPLGNNFCSKFKTYFSEMDESLNRTILGAAHLYASRWEFNVIQQANPNGYQIQDIRRELQAQQEKYYLKNLASIQRLELYSDLKNLVDLCGQLRFQVRWSHLHRVPRTSVLGHMLITAILTYLFSLEINACKKRLINNYFTALFHDMPEILTRDITDPVKKSGIEDLIAQYETEEMDERIYPLIPSTWHSDMKLFTCEPFLNIITKEDKREVITSDKITESFNEDKYEPRDGELVKSADHLAAFVEAYLVLENGIRSKEFEEAKFSLKEKYTGRTIGGVKLGEVYEDFD